MKLPSGGYVPNRDTKPGAPPRGPAGASSANPVTYTDLQASVVLGRGIVIDTAPEHTKIAVGVLAGNHLGIRLDEPGIIRVAEQVAYEITGYDPTDCTLTLHLVRDWRPGHQKP